MKNDRKYSRTSRIVIFLIRAYQTILSPILPSSCRYHPSCSQYAIQAIQKYGAIRGGLKAVIRIFKCNPFFPGGYDPI